MKNKKTLSHLIKGFTVGSSMLIPGVSGGTMAIMLGIYSDLIEAVSSFFDHKKKSLCLLGVFSLGAIIGILLLARPLLFLTETYHMPMMYLFIGAVAGSIPLICRQANVQKVSVKAVAFPCIGIGVVVLIGLIPKNLIPQTAATGWSGYLILVLAGIFAAIALVLPGISVSYLLLVLGIYDKVMLAIQNLQFAYLLPLGIGLIAGILLTTKLLGYLLTRYPQATYLVILGFVIGSVLQVFPGIPSGWELLLCPVLFGCSFFAMYRLSLLEAQA